MPNRNIRLTAEQDAVVETALRSGDYQNASEVIGDALRVLRQHRREDALKLKALRLHIEAGVGTLERGDFIEVHDKDIDKYLKRLTSAQDED